MENFNLMLYLYVGVINKLGKICNKQLNVYQFYTLKGKCVEALEKSTNYCYTYIFTLFIFTLF